MDKFLTWSYWFTLRPGTWQEFGTLVLGLGLGLVILAMVFKLAVKIFKIKGVLAKFFSKLAVWSVTIGLLDLVFWFFRDQGVPFFSARFWLLLLSLLAGVWLVFILIFLIKKRSLASQEKERAEEFDKYLPGRK